MDLAEIVCGHKQADRRLVVFQLSGPAKTEPDKPLVEMPHGQIGPFDMACANSVAAGIGRSKELPAVPHPNATQPQRVAY